MEEELKSLIELDLLKLFDMEGAAEEERVAFLQRCMDDIFAAVVSRIKEDLPEDAKQEFNDTFKDGVPEERRIAFLQKYVPDINEMIINAILAFKKSAQGAVVAIEASSDE
ncbi:MAG: hypothetical protein HY007_02335 [Candidatus Sungbacteria bacterium]|nr:hypothetical protein [Candidatus Sungbacteria bacterium]